VRFLADESCDYGVVKTLRTAGHDVAAVVEDSPGTADREVFARSRREQRVLLTEDKDFGQLAVATELGEQEGLILIRCPEQSRGDLPAAISALVAADGHRLVGALVVWTPTRVRFRSLRGESGPEPD
jgi:predicted nuclease of predicted toxin-antitoxin system